MATSLQAQTPARPVVLELFTSLNCPSCPAADALMQELSADPSLITLSFHVNYMDTAAWRDPFSSQENTDRQHDYALMLGVRNFFTPELIVDGRKSVVGSNRDKVLRAIEAAKAQVTSVPLTLTRTNAGTATLSIPAAATGSAVAVIDVIHYQSMTSVDVLSGGVNGTPLTRTNNVTGITQLGEWKNSAQTYTIPIPPNEGMVVLVQDDASGRMLGTAVLSAY